MTFERESESSIDTRIDKLDELFGNKTIEPLTKDGFEKLGNPLEKTKEKTIWWVNQGATLDIEQKGGFVWAPLKSKSGQTI